MKPSILQLNGYSFAEIAVRCLFREDLNKTQPSLSVDDIDFELQNLERDGVDIEQEAMVRLKVMSKTDEGPDHQHYAFVLEALATISFCDQEQQKSMAEKILVINGANLLYGIMREKLHSLTSTMIWGPAMLPLVTFDGLSKIADTMIEEKPKKKGKTK